MKMAISFETFKKSPIIYILYLCITAVVFLYFQDKFDQNGKSSELTKQNAYLLDQNEKLNSRIFYFDSLLRECMQDKAQSKTLDSLKK